LDIKIAKATEELEKKKQEKHREHHKLHKLQVYESFLEKVMISSQDYEKDEKKRENIKKMIERYRLLIDKQKSLKEETYRRDEERVPLQIYNKNLGKENQSKVETGDRSPEPNPDQDLGYAHDAG
jgi:hypothetical protein